VGVVISVDDAIRERADMCANRVMMQFGSAILPIYASCGKFYKHIGTCTAIVIDEQQFLVTAGHVLDENKNGQLWVGGYAALVPLCGRYIETLPPGGVRKQDHHDFAVIEVNEKFADQLGDILYIGEESISKNRRRAEKKVLYLCVGYPNSKNKELHATRREVNANFWNHVAPGHFTHDEIGPWAKTTTDHLFIDLPKKHARNTEGQIINAVHPRGSSGGPVFYIGDFADYDTYAVDKECRPMLEAIIIEGYVNHRVLVATQIRSVVEALRDATIGLV
jgi:hypothetical protein